jgi:signal transduction histidine kinase
MAWHGMAWHGMAWHGMGLSVCRSIIDAHHGRIWASSDAGPGLVFQSTLPSVREDAAQG